MRRKRKRRNIVPIIIILAIIVAAAGVLFLTGTFKFKQADNRSSNRTAMAYITSGNSIIVINSDGIVLKKSASLPSGVPEFTGLEVTSSDVDEEIECSDQGGLSYLMSIAGYLIQYDIPVTEINYSDEYEATVYSNNIKILLGRENKTGEKIRDLNDFYDQIKDLRGTLHMEAVNENIGYTFKQEADPVTEAETTETQPDPNAADPDAQPEEAVQPEEETAPVEEVPAEEIPAEEVPVEDIYVEEVPAEDVYVEDVPQEDVYVEEAPVEDVYVEEAPQEDIYVEDVYVEEIPVEEQY